MSPPAPAAARPSRKRRLHIGHHFFGSGNLGDDLMLAGFLGAIGEDVELTCCSAYDVKSQRRRFPGVQWLPYAQASRAAAIQACDAWVGVGDTPFQLSVGPWFLDHLAGEMEICRAAVKPMFFVGVGIEGREALRDERARAVLEYATRVWARDAWSAEELSKACGAAKVRQGADLAHVCLRDHPPRGPLEPNAVGYVLNFEDPAQFNHDAFCALVDAAGSGTSHRWLVQEVRTLPGSELDLWPTLPEACRAQLELRRPDYAAPSVDELLAPWGRPGRVISSRYHGALAAAWSGARVAAVERSGKVKGFVSELGLTSIPALYDDRAARDALARATRVPLALLATLASRAAASCAELLSGA